MVPSRLFRGSTVRNHRCGLQLDDARLVEQRVEVLLELDVPGQHDVRARVDRQPPRVYAPPPDVGDLLGELGQVDDHAAAEHALDVNYARALGVKVDELLISQPDHGEQALEITETLVRSGAIDVVVVDSVAALVPRAELEGDMGDSQPGAQARLMSQALRKLTGAINKSNCTVIFINQIREKIGVMFGSPKTTSGGKALKFYASVRMEITRIGAIKKGDQIIGNRTKIKVTKNKMAPPFRQAEFEIYYGEGVSKEAELIDMGVQAGSVRKSGSWYARGDERLGQGKENARQFLKEHPQLAAEIQHEILQFHGVIPADVPPPEAPSNTQVAEA